MSTCNAKTVATVAAATTKPAVQDGERCSRLNLYVATVKQSGLGSIANQAFLPMYAVCPKMQCEGVRRTRCMNVGCSRPCLEGSSNKLEWSSPMITGRVGSVIYNLRLSIELRELVAEAENNKCYNGNRWLQPTG